MLQQFAAFYCRKAMRFGRRYDPAAVLEKIFNVHGWGDAWRNGIYDFVHYHSMIHEALGFARGSAFGSVAIKGGRSRSRRAT